MTDLKTWTLLKQGVIYLVTDYEGNCVAKELTARYAVLAALKVAKQRNLGVTLFVSTAMVHGVAES